MSLLIDELESLDNSLLGSDIDQLFERFGELSLVEDILREEKGAPDFNQLAEVVERLLTFMRTPPLPIQNVIPVLMGCPTVASSEGGGFI